MTRSRTITFLANVALIPIAAVSVAACGGGGGATAATSPKPASRASATVGVAATSLGKVLVDSQGRTLYLFKADRGTNSACTGACATAWPPLIAHGKPTVGPGANVSLLRTAKRTDGTQQVTYNGHPLYLFVSDQSRGDVSGQGVTAFGAAWFVLSTEGNQVSAKPASTSGGLNSGGGSGY